MEDPLKSFVDGREPKPLSLVGHLRTKVYDECAARDSAAAIGCGMLWNQGADGYDFVNER
jgi:hypothetical protein